MIAQWVVVAPRAALYELVERLRAVAVGGVQLEVAAVVGDCWTAE